MIKANPSPANVSSSASSRSASKPTPARQASNQDFDALLNQADALNDADAGLGLSADGLRRDGQADAGEMEQLESRRDDNQQPATAAEEAARASLRPTNQPLRSETASEITPRRILHVADMEKIVATVRAQTFSGNEAQATIQLSHSILNGLSIKLQTDARGRVSAEITATTDAAKRIVDAHARELNNMLQARGLEVASFSTTLAEDGGGSSAGGDGGASAQSSFGRRGFANLADEPAETASENIVPQSGGDGIYMA